MSGMEFAAVSNPDLAAALFRLMGANVPVEYSCEAQARHWYDSLSTDQQRLQKVLMLCGTPQTPQQLYLAARAASWLGGMDEQTAQYAQAYLESPGWSALPSGSITEQGIVVDRRIKQRAELYAILAQAQENLGKHEIALANYQEAYRLEPYQAMYALKAADILWKHRSRKEAMNYLRHQKSSPYYRHTVFTDERGNREHNDTFRHLIDSHLLKLESLEQEEKMA